MDALKRSLAGEKQSAPPAKAAKEGAKGKKPRKAAAGQREMLLPISGSGKGAAKAKESAEEGRESRRGAARPRVKKAG